VLSYTSRGAILGEERNARSGLLAAGVLVITAALIARRR
jgi:hypothetical protein